MKFACNLLLSFILFPLALFAQSNFKPGYVVTLKGDTVKGFIDYKEWDSNPKEISFKTDINNSSGKKYKATDLIFFSISHYEYFKQYSGTISMDILDHTADTKTNGLSDGADNRTITDVVFLKVIAGSQDVTLYSYKDDLKERFFIAEQNNQPVELIKKVYKDTVTAELAVQNTYKTQLQRLAYTLQPQNAALKEQIQRAAYAKNDLKSIIEKLSNSKPSNMASDNGSGVRYFAGIGINDAVTKFTGTNDFTKSGTYSSIMPALNFGVDILFNKNIKRFVFRTEIAVTSSEGKFSYNGPDPASYSIEPNYIKSYKFKHYTFSLNPQLLYNFYNTNKLRIYAALGIGVYFSKNSEQENKKEYTVSKTIEYSTPYDLSSTYFGITTKVGLMLNNKFDVFMGYNPSSSLTQYLLFSISSASYNAGIRYYLGR